MEEKTYIVRWYVHDEEVHTYERTEYLFQLKPEARLQKDIFRAGMGVLDNGHQIKDVTHYEIVDKKTKEVVYSDKSSETEQSIPRSTFDRFFRWIWKK